MIQNYVTIAVRNILKQKSYTILNVLGLSLGMAASLLILQYAKYERSFDTFHNRAEDIYRIQFNGYHDGELNFESALSVPAILPYLKDNFPEVEQTARVYPQTGVMSYESPSRGLILFQERRIQYAAPDFLRMFNFRIVEGDSETCLDGNNKLIISQKTANKYFTDENPIGKRMTFNGDLSFEVTAIYEDVPENSHIRFDILLSYETLNASTQNESETAWGWNDYYSFVRLTPGSDVPLLQKKIDGQLLKERGESWKNSNTMHEFILRPLLDIHLKSHLLYEAEPDEQRDADSIYGLVAIAFFILSIAWVNYINLATARSFHRANEIGVRKVMGAVRSQLIWQFLTESFFMNMVSCVIALLAVRLSWSSFSNLAGWNIPLSYMNEGEFWILVILIFLFGTILSGFYPAIVMSSFEPVTILKGTLLKSTGGSLLRKSLVVFQFTSSVCLIVGSIVVYSQLRFMKHQDLGLSIDETLVLNGPGVIVDSLYAARYDAFKSEIIKIPGVKSMTASSSIPGKEIYWSVGIRLLAAPATDEMVVAGAAIDQDFTRSYGIKILAGRDFEKSFTHDDKRLIINLALSKALGFKEPGDAIGKMVVFSNDTLELMGVAEDFHQMSLKTPIVPLAMGLGYSSRFFSMKVETANYYSVVSALQEPWAKFFPGNPVDYFFLDEFFNKQYDKDDRFGQVFTLFTGLAIFIASLGLFGLASFMALQRTREIGIRKVLGSSVSGIVMLLAKGFLQPVLLANLIAWPLSWWVMDRWLEGFPYRISVNPAYLLAAGLMVVVIAFISVSSQTLKAAMTKPAETLKYE